MFNKLIVCLAAVLVTSFALAKSPQFPATSADGLDLVPHSQFRALYMKPGANLSEYDKIALLKTYVSFAKNWQRNYNEDAPFEERVSDKDMKQIRDNIATEFAKEMTKVLSTEGGHTLVSEGATGVLILRPAIINLEVTAPDTMSPGMSMTFVASAGSMTLYLELYDGKTGDIIARIIDPEAADNAGMAEIADSVTNTADFDRVIIRWAKILNSHLTNVTKKP